jgi:glutamate--cysteine ligase
MPCVVDGEKSVPIARYGSSNQGMIKHVYRRGLGYRYGKVMQVIAGIHFNYSLPESFWPVFQTYEQNSSSLQTFRSQSYFALVRNVQRFGWLLYYLFGASPAVCKSFLKGRESNLAEYDANTYFLPYATSLRMSDLGYTNAKRCRLKMSYDNLESYAAGLKHALTTPCPPYEEIGVKVDGEYRQLNANILQIENEYYNIVRPKQPPRDHERTLQALLNRGVEYVELRSNDVGIFDPLGFDETQLRFLEAFLLFCLLYESPPINSAEQVNIELNQIEVARNGRDPELQLHCGEQQKSFKAWAAEICEMMQGICELLDQGQPEQLYQRCLEQQRAAIEDPDRTPSAHVLAAMKESGMGFFHFVKTLSKQHQEYFLSLPFSRELQGYFEDLAQQSHQQQAAMEAADSLSFDEYLVRYSAQ